MFPFVRYCGPSVCSTRRCSSVCRAACGRVKITVIEALGEGVVVETIAV